MLYEFVLTRDDGTSAKESFTAVNDKKAIQRLGSVLERHSGQHGGVTYRLLDDRGKEIVRQTAVPKVGQA